MHENKSNSPDATRKWIEIKINELIDIMNHKTRTSNYDKETFRILFESLFIKFHLA